MKQKGFYFAFFWLALIIVIIYFFQLTISNYTSLFVLNNLALEGEYYRFLTAIFLHGSHSHLLYNLFALILFGFILERIVGTKNFLILFFSSGIIANIISVLFYPSSLGASGAIYGILGAVAVLRPKMNVFVFGVILPMWLAVIVWVVGDVIGIFIPDNVGHIAHLSGIFVGFLFTMIILKQYSLPKKRKNKVYLHEPSMRYWEERYMK